MNDDTRHILGLELAYELPCEVTSMKVVNDVLVVECVDGVTHIISKKAIEDFKLKRKTT